MRLRTYLVHYPPPLAYTHSPRFFSYLLPFSAVRDEDEYTCTWAKKKEVCSAV